MDGRRIVTSPSEPPPVDLRRAVADDSGDLQLVLTTSGHCRYASDAGLRLFGMAPAALLGQQIEELLHPDDAALEVAAILACLAQVDGASSSVTRFRCADGTYRWVETVHRSVQVARVQLVILSIRDVNDRHAAEDILQLRASTDDLTGLSNRNVLLDRVDRALLHLERREGLVALLLFDVDEFKQVNDAFGHPAGDVVLIAIARRLREAIRPEDTVARLGGDEFVALLEGVGSVQEVQAAAVRIVRDLNGPIAMVDGSIECTVSVGVTITDRWIAPGDLLQQADVALYRAKRQGRDRIEVAAPWAQEA